MSKLLVVCALPQELDNTQLPRDIPVVFTGIGKLNAALGLRSAIDHHKPDLVINFGTAGRLSPRIGGLVEVARVIQHDMDAHPLAPRGITPLDDTPGELISGQEGVLCATGDKFVRDRDPWMIQNNVDIVDMELFAIALVCHRMGISWRSFKYITDDADENSHKDWQESAHKGRSSFVETIESLLS